MELNETDVLRMLFPSEVMTALTKQKREVLIQQKKLLQAKMKNGFTIQDVNACIASIYELLGKQTYIHLLKQSKLSKKMQSGAHCSWCRSEHASLRCECKNHYYCSPYCKKMHWKNSHRKHKAHVRYQKRNC